MSPFFAVFGTRCHCEISKHQPDITFNTVDKTWFFSQTNTHVRLYAEIQQENCCLVSPTWHAPVFMFLLTKTGGWQEKTACGMVWLASCNRRYVLIWLLFSNDTQPLLIRIPILKLVVEKWLSEDTKDVFFQRADMAAQALTNLYTRSQVMDYMFPFYTTMTIDMYIQKAQHFDTGKKSVALEWNNYTLNNFIKEV